MIVTCPNCSVKLNLNAKQAAKNPNAWLKCPKCKERFHNQSLEFISSSFTAAPNKGQSSNSARHNSLLNQVLGKMNLASYAKEKTPNEDPSSILELLPVVEGKRSKKSLVLGAVGVLIGLFLMALALIFHQAKAPPPAPVPDHQQPVASYSEQQLSEDLISIRKEMTRLGKVNMLVAYKGRESRFIKYYLNFLAPEMCQDITSIHIKSNRTSEGFKAQTFCADPSQKSAVVDIAWKGNDIAVSIDGKEEVANLTVVW
ncbi:MAG: zinc-ribbon domain-containing protein [Deltaproteobacteria bacterium]|jgi:hypothetical protein|nr:zinc-ribbon domain-containing protein [Deltaproteobacteria bacterium]